ncbi:barstar family protein [Hyunsoonleella flava]|uniref:barstar family protein n=1 Tax=Hyunsoonleella flava TaxID=2527939 RepID=UPI0013EEF1ED|nr:barstar family protein [Hyunsoonleella flava]
MKRLMELKEDKIGKDIEILKDGPICKYFKNGILDKDLNWFNNKNFEVIEMNCRNWNRKNAHRKLKDALNFPDYYGENMNAFADCLTDMYNKKHRGLVLVFRSYDSFVEEDVKFAEAILDIIARESRIWLLTGQKLIGLIQSDNPDLDFPELGGTSPIWNPSEWFNADRKNNETSLLIAVFIERMKAI